jgi:uncharacterized protein YybS (DUF2232 family)
MQTSEKVTNLGHDPKKLTSKEAEEIKNNTNRDLGKVALFISLMAIILLVVFFFGLNQNMTGLTDEVKEISALQEQMSSMESRMVTVEEDVAALENLPQEARRMVVRSMLQEMAQRVRYMSIQVENEQQSTKLNQAMELLEEVQVDLQK